MKYATCKLGEWVLSIKISANVMTGSFCSGEGCQEIVTVKEKFLCLLACSPAWHVTACGCFPQLPQEVTVPTYLNPASVGTSISAEAVL